MATLAQIPRQPLGTLDATRNRTLMSLKNSHNGKIEGNLHSSSARVDLRLKLTSSSTLGQDQRVHPIQNRIFLSQTSL